MKKEKKDALFIILGLLFFDLTFSLVFRINWDKMVQNEFLIGIGALVVVNLIILVNISPIGDLIIKDLVSKDLEDAKKGYVWTPFGKKKIIKD